MKIFTRLANAGCVFLLLRIAFAGRCVMAGIAVQTTVVPWDLSDPQAVILQQNGWEAIDVRLVADGIGGNVTIWDFKDPTNGFTDLAHNPKNLTVGISGPVLQAWSVPSKGATPTSTPQIPLATNGGQIPQNNIPSTTYDSFWGNFPVAYDYINFIPPVENNNLANVDSNLANNYLGSPLADVSPETVSKYTIPGTDYGVGSFMTVVGDIRPIQAPYSPDYPYYIHTAPQSVDLAYLIVPVNAEGGNDVTIFGVAGDTLGYDYTISQLLNPSLQEQAIASSVIAPEPANLVPMVVGAAMFFNLVRRGRVKRAF